MSVDMLMYEVQKLDEDDRTLLKGTIVDEVECPDEGSGYQGFAGEYVEPDSEELVKGRSQRLNQQQDAEEYACVG